MKSLTIVNTSVMPEKTVLDMASIFLVEVSSNVYFLKKHRHSKCHGKFVDGEFVAKELNTNFDVAIKKMDGEILANFSRVTRREFLANTLNREII